MKKNKLAKRIQIILVTVFVIAIGTMIVGVLSNNNAMAVTCVSGCTDTTLTLVQDSYDSAYHYYTCSGCDEQTSEKHTLSEEYCVGISDDDSSHDWYRNCDCGLEIWLATGACVPDSNSICIYCKEYTSNIGGDDGEETHTCTYKYVYEEDDGSYHTINKVCTECGAEEYYDRVYHNFGEYSDNEDGTHSAICADCDYELTENHTGGNHENGGECAKCEVIYELHGETTELSGEYIDITGTTHTPLYKCSHEGCDKTFEGEPEQHTEAIKEGKTATCTESGISDKTFCSDCGEILKEQAILPALGHSFTNYLSNNDATCENDGTKTAKCDRCDETDTVRDYGSQITHIFETYTDNGDGEHSAICEMCEYELIEPHSYENGECTKCGFKEVVLEITSEIYIINGEYITNVQPRTTVSKFKSNIETNATEIKLYNSNNEELSSSDQIETGTKLELIKGEQIKKFTIIVKGDVNGDGDADFQDIVKINQAILNKVTLEEIYSIAADVNGDGEKDLKDLVKINRFRLYKITEL